MDIDWSKYGHNPEVDELDGCELYQLKHDCLVRAMAYGDGGDVTVLVDGEKILSISGDFARSLGAMLLAAADIAEGKA